MRRIAANYIYTCKQILKNGVLHIDDDGVVVDVIDTGGNLKESQGIEFYNGVIIPGLVNSHCHLELSHLKGEIPSGSGLPDFLKNVMGRRATEAEQVKAAAERADRWMKANGIVAVGDIMNTDAALNVKHESSIKYHHFLEVMGVSKFRSEQTFTWACTMYDQLKETSNCSVVPHAPYSVCSTLLNAVKKHAEANHGIYTIHHAETPSERDLVRSLSGDLYNVLSSFGIDYSAFDLVGDDSFSAIERFLPSGQNVLLVHNTCMDNHQILVAQKSNFNLFWVLCPKSNLYLEQKMPDINLLREYGCKIALGTDSLGSNTTLSILEEMKIISEYYPSLGLDELVLWACLNGAEALRLDDEIGSIEKGKKPGINLIQNLDLKSMKLTGQSAIKVLV